MDQFVVLLAERWSLSAIAGPLPLTVPSVLSEQWVWGWGMKPFSRD